MADTDSAPTSPTSGTTSGDSAPGPAVDQRPSATTTDLPAFGWSAYAERINGRFAMVGLVAVVVIEVVSGQTFLQWAGLVP